jgi:hypothetical protein
MSVSRTLRCERCEADLWADSGKPVVSANGIHHDHPIDAEPGVRLWCSDCWDERERERKTNENHALAAFGNGGEQA